MHYPHWLMIAGACLVVVGFIGLAFRKNNAASLENNLKQSRVREAGLKAKAK
jgi:hypothetical protein